jgi:endonuclease/exonuclease/phosphatase family metal-dependent hydrolase
MTEYIAIKSQAEVINIFIIQVYMQTSGHEFDEVEALCDIIEVNLEEDGKGNTSTITMGDWNNVVGDESYGNFVGSHGLGIMNNRGQMLINFCERNGMIFSNTWFTEPKGRLYTWKTPGDRIRSQLDYIRWKNRFRNSVENVQTLHGAHIDSDHNLLVVIIYTILKNIIRFRKRSRRWDLEKFMLKLKECRIL